MYLEVNISKRLQMLMLPFRAVSSHQSCLLLPYIIIIITYRIVTVTGNA